MEMVENQVKKTLLCVYECFASVYKVYKYAPCLGQKKALDLLQLDDNYELHVSVGKQTQVLCNAIKCFWNVF